MSDIFFENQTADGESEILKQTGNDKYVDSEFLIKVTGDLGGGSIQVQYDFNDDDYAPLLGSDGESVKTIAAVGIIEVLVKSGCRMKLVLSGSTAADVTAKRI
jgi:hypothetical protein